MNSYVKISLSNGYYFFREYSTGDMDTLGAFLTSDVRCYVPGFKEWAQSDDYSNCGGNLSYLEKEGAFILLSYENSIFPQAEQFKIPKQAFIDLLDDWGKMCKQKPPHILGQRFTVEALND